MANVQTYSSEKLAEISRELEEQTPQQILQWGVDEFHPHLTLACSFGGPSGLVLVDMISEIEPQVEVFYLDTDLLFPETYATRDRVIERYGIQPVAYKSALTVDQQAEQHGDELWRRDPDLCCQLRKVEPNQRALAGKHAWIAGIRRDQGATRRETPVVAWDEKYGLVKVIPLARWTEADVWAYIAKHDLPYNPLHDRSYPSIGCTHCTVAVKPGEDPRAGRWPGMDKIECGINVQDGPIKLTRGQEIAG